MRPNHLVLAAALLGTAGIAAISCAQGAADTSTDDSTENGADGGGGGGDDGSPSADSPSCGETCDSDGDKVPDPSDKCPNTPPGAKVNKDGCAESQLPSKLEPTFPPFGLTWTPTGNLGRAGGLTWTYTGIQRGDLFHIWWVVCDDPATPCGLSLDGPIDTAAEKWAFSATDSSLAAGKLVFTNTTQISIADAGTPTVSGRLTITITDPGDVPIPFADVATLGVVARDGEDGAEIGGTGYKVKAIVEVLDAMTWKPYMDYYDAAATQNTGDAGGNATISFGASFYDK